MFQKSDDEWVDVMPSWSKKNNEERKWKRRGESLKYARIKTKPTRIYFDNGRRSILVRRTVGHDHEPPHGSKCQQLAHAWNTTELSLRENRWSLHTEYLPR